MRRCAAHHGPGAEHAEAAGRADAAVGDAAAGNAVAGARALVGDLEQLQHLRLSHHALSLHPRRRPRHPLTHLTTARSSNRSGTA